MTVKVRRALVATAGVAAAALMLLSTAASGASPARSGGTAANPVRVAFLIATTSAGYPRGILASARIAAKKHNVSLTVFDAQFNPQKQFAQCQDAISSGRFDAIVTLPAASPAMVPCARLAASKRMPLISTDTPIGSNLKSGKPSIPGVTAQVLVPAIPAFASLKRSVLSACAKVGGGSSCHVGFIIGVKALALSTPASGLLKGWVKQAGGVYVGEGEGFYQRGGGLKVMQTLLQKDPDLNVLVSLSDDMALGAEIAMKAAGKVPGQDVLILTQGGSYPGVARLRAGTWWATSVASAESEGRVPIEIAVKAVAGKKVPSYVNSSVATGIPQVINKANLKRYPKFKGTFPA